MKQWIENYLVPVRAATFDRLRALPSPNLRLRLKDIMIELCRYQILYLPLRLCWVCHTLPMELQWS